MIVHTQSLQRGPVPVDDAREGAGTILTSGQGGPGAVPSDSMAAVIPFGQLDPNDLETLKQLALYLLGIGTVVIRTAQDQRVAWNAIRADSPISGSDGAEVWSFTKSVPDLVEEELLYFKACPRCATGTVEATEEWDGRNFLCLNCGFTLEVTATTAMSEHRSDERRKNLESVV